MASEFKATPKYLQLKDEILAWFDAGRYRAGDQMPTEHEIAEQYGVSRQTVRQTFGELEREGRIYRVQGKGTFVSVPPAAPALEGPAAVKTVGLVTTYISDYIFPHIVRGAEAVLRERGYRMLLSSTDNDKREEKLSLEQMRSEPLSGLIVEPTRSAESNSNLGLYLALDYNRIPYVMINERYPELSCPVIKVNDEGGTFQATDHLIRLGHRRLAGFFKVDDLQGVNRLKGFLRAHQEHGVALAPEAVVHYTTETKAHEPYRAAMALLERPDRPTAFVCYNDELAVKLLEAIRQAGLRVPEQVSIVGFDDSAYATATEVKLTTLTHPKFEMGALAAEWIIGMIEGRPLAQLEHIFEPELIVRDSTSEPL